MQTSERNRFMEAYRDEIAGRVALGAKCAVCVLVIAVLTLAASGTRDRGAAETPAPPYAAAGADEGDTRDKKPVVDEQQGLSPSPVFAP